MKKTWLKLFVFAFVLAVFAPMTGVAEAREWRSAGSVDGVNIYFMVEHTRDLQLNIFWKAENRNPYPVLVDITNRVYKTSVGTLSNNMRFGFELKPGRSSEGMVPMNDSFSLRDHKTNNIVVHSAQCNTQVTKKK